MVLTTEFKRYTCRGICNIVGSTTSPIDILDQNVVVAAACEDVYLWDLRKNTKVGTIVGDKHPVTCLRVAASAKLVAIGFTDGSVKVYELDVNLESPKCVLAGHKSSITTLNFDSNAGLQLVSGSKDTTIVVWDLVSECGVVKLKGHKGPVTSCQFIKDRNLLVSSSKDSFVKFWDLTSQHCFYTIFGHRSEVWDLQLLNDGNRLICGSAEAELRIFDIHYIEDGEISVVAEKAIEIDKESEDQDETNGLIRCEKNLNFLRSTKGRVVQMACSSDQQLLVVLSVDNAVEFVKIFTAEELQKKLKKQEKKLKQKAEADETPEIEPAIAPFELMVSLGTFRLSSKPKSVCFAAPKSKETYRVNFLLSSNTVEQYEVTVEGKKFTAVQTSNLNNFGHKTDVRTLSFSNDNSAIISGSQESLKIWNRSSLACVRTMEVSDAISSLFVPGDKHCVVGTKDGKLLIYDIASSVLMETVNAHSGTVWSLCLYPDLRGLVSASADKEVKFWEFELVDKEEKKVLTLTHKRTLSCTEDVLCVNVSSNQKFIAVGLLDNTAKVFFFDSLKFFLNLYGHSLPVLCLDISHDSKLIVTGSADKNVKIWGLDFGDCHRSLFAHDDSVTSVKFLSKSHTFFSTGKDGTIKQWDADKFQKIQVLKGHQGEIWAMAVTSNGHHVVTAAHDRSIRLWEKSDELLVLEEEQEMEREEESEKLLEQTDDVIPGEVDTEAVLAGKKTIETVRSTDAILEALDVADQELIFVKEEPNPDKREHHPLFKAYGSATVDQFILEVIRKIRSSELERSLLMLPFAKVPPLLSHLANCVEVGYETELATRCLLLLMRIHHAQLISSEKSGDLVWRVKNSVEPRVSQLRDLLGVNLAALKLLQLEMAEKSDVQMFMDATAKVQKRRSKNKLSTAQLW